MTFPLVIDRFDAKPFNYTKNAIYLDYIKKLNFFPMFKRYSIAELLLAILLFIGTTGISISKAILFTSPKIYYIIFLSSLVVLVALLLKKRDRFVKETLILTFTAEIILLLTNNLTHKLHWGFDVLSGLWLLFLAFEIIRHWHHKHNINTVRDSDTKLYTPVTIIFLAIVMLVHFGFGFYHLGKAAYVDERLWTYSNEKRIEKYWNNILEMDWKHTRPSDKPGVTLAFISGPSLLFTTPSDFKDEITDKQSFESMFFAMRLPILLFSTFALLIFYHILGKLFNPKISILSTTFIGLSSILLGVSRIINPDALSWIFIPLTLLAYFTFLKTKNIKWVYATGFLLGLGLLTKYIANLLFPFFLITLITFPFFFEHTKKELRQYLRFSFSSVGIITLISLITFYIFYPGTWVKMDRLLIGTIWSQPFEPVWKIFVLTILALILDYFFNRSSILLWITLQIQKIRKFFVYLIPLIFLITIFSTIYFVYISPQTINFEHILSSPKTALLNDNFTTPLYAFVTSFYVLIFGIIPITLVGTIITLLSFFSKKLKATPFQQSTLWHLCLFIILFYVGSIFSTTIPTVRYQIILYPLIFILSAFGLHQIYNIFFTQKKSIIFYTFVTIIIIGSSYLLYTLKPFYFSFNNPLLPKNYLINPKDMGDGNYEVAEYLNSLPNATGLSVWSDKRGVCTFFVGDCVSVIRKADFIENGPDYDYYVISKGREARTVDLSRGYSQMRKDYPVRLDILYTENPGSTFELNPGNRKANYIKVIPKENTNVWRGN